MVYDLFVYDFRNGFHEAQFDFVLNPGGHSVLSVPTKAFRNFTEAVRPIGSEIEAFEQLRRYHLKESYRTHLKHSFKSSAAFWSDMCEKIRTGTVFVVGCSCDVLGRLLIEVLDDIQQLALDTFKRA